MHIDSEETPIAHGSEKSKAHSSDFVIREFRTLTPEILELRRQIYQDEVGYLTETTVTTDDDEIGGLIIGIFDRHRDLLVATAQVLPAAGSEFQKSTGLSEDELKEAVFITRCMVAPAYRRQGLFTAVVYLGMRYGRLHGARDMVCLAEDGEIPAAKILGYEPCEQLPTRVLRGQNGKTFRLTPCTVSLAKGMMRCYDRSPQPIKILLQETFGDEAIATVTKRLDQFFENPFFKVIAKRSLTRNQYVTALCNMHQFVRWTTRILARAISLTPDKQLRRHFIDHMRGEIDHEVIIEKDLASLDEEVNYLTTRMIPNVATQQFMVIQESFLAFHQDSRLYLAVPFSIEGFSARLDQTFLANLEACIRSWGYSQPKKATRFIASHIEYDGGDDGHWAKNQQMVRQVLSDERDLQLFLNAIHLTMDSLEKTYASFVNFYDLASAQATARPEFEVLWETRPPLSVAE